MSEIKFCDICEYTIIGNEDYKTDELGRYAHSGCVADIYGGEFDE